MIKPHGSEQLMPLYVADDSERAALAAEAQNLTAITISSAAAANAVIANNDKRLEKTLWTSAEEGPQIKLVANYDEYEEAHNIIDTIQAKSKSVGLNNIAVLYRSNAQSRVIEEALLQQAIPYRVYGGFRFFDRAEVKDALAYLRLSVNQNDDLAFERASSMPPKGLGAKTLSDIQSFAQTEGVSLFVGASQLLEHSLISGRAKNAVHDLKTVGNSLIELIDKLRVQKSNNIKFKDISYLIVVSGSASDFGESEYRNYTKSYERAYYLYKFWQQEGIDLDDDKYHDLVEFQIAGNGIGGVGRFEDQEKNQRFIINIIPKIGEI